MRSSISKEKIKKEPTIKASRMDQKINSNMKIRWSIFEKVLILKKICYQNKFL